MNEQLRLPLSLYRRVAAATVVVPLVLFVFMSSRHLILLELALLWHWLSISWVSNRRDVWSASRVATALCLVEWSAAVAITAVEGWTIHLTPLMCLGPVLMAIQSVDTKRYRQLVAACVALIAAMTILARLTEPGPIRKAASDTMVDTIAIVAIPSLAGIVALMAWLNHGAMFDRKEMLLLSRSRLYRADELARMSFAESSVHLRERVREIQRLLLRAGDSTAFGYARTMVQDVSAEVRATAHGLGIVAFHLEEPTDIAELVSHVGRPVDVTTEDLGPRNAVVDSVARAFIYDSFSCSEQVASSKVCVAKLAKVVVITVEHDGWRHDHPIELETLTVDRVDAIGGTVSLPPVDEGRAQAIVELPLAKAEMRVLSATPPRSLRDDLRYGVAFPLASVTSSFVIWATVLPQPEMLSVLLQFAFIYTLPCAIAIPLATRRPNLAISIFVASHWLTAIVIARQLNIIKYFVAIALLIPLLMALPHVSRAIYTMLTAATCAVIGLTIGLVRLSTQLEVTKEAPDIVTDILIVILIPLGSGLVLLISEANHNAIAAIGLALARSRRRLVEATDAARRLLERDLHDGAQQRLVSAGLRIQIAERLDDESKIVENTNLALSELSRAVTLLADLSKGPSRSAVESAGIGPALHRLASLSPLPVHVTLTPIAPDLPSEVETAIWYCCTEALANTIKHAGELAEVRIDLRSDTGEVSFEITDNGVGFAASPSSGLGLRNMEERLEQHGGSVEVVSRLGHGTSVRGQIPKDELQLVP